MIKSDIAVLCPKCRAKIGTISEDFKTEKNVQLVALVQIHFMVFRSYTKQRI